MREKIDELSRVFGQELHEPWKVGQLFHVGNVPQIACQDRCKAGTRPTYAAALALAIKHLWKSSTHGPANDVVANIVAPHAMRRTCMPAPYKDDWKGSMDLSAFTLHLGIGIRRTY